MRLGDFDPVKGDWITTALSDLTSLKINLSMEEIQMSTKNHFKALVKENMRREAFVYLMDIKASHSKTKNLVYDKLTIQDYLTSYSPLTLKEKKFVFSARCRMTEVRCNFKTGQMDLKCRKCREEEESQEHLLKCPELLKCPDQMKYLDLFGKDLVKLAAIGKFLLRCYNLVISMPIVHSPALNRASAATM